MGVLTSLNLWDSKVLSSFKFNYHNETQSGHFAALNKKIFSFLDFEPIGFIMKKRFDLDTVESSHSGIKGFFESLLRRFKTFVHILLLMPIYFIASFTLGLSLIPAVFLFNWVHESVQGWSFWAQNCAYAFSIAAGYFLYGFTLIAVVPFLNFIFRTKLHEWRGPYYSVETIKWYIHNGLTYLARYTFLEFVTPTPISIQFYQMMGMKIGRDVALNTIHISDPSLIEIGDKATLGGSVTLVAHYGQGGLLIIAPIKIGKGCTIGLKATIMGGSVIGDGAKVMPHSVVLPKTTIPAGETWGGVPAQKIQPTALAPSLSLLKAS